MDRFCRAWSGHPEESRHHRRSGRGRCGSGWCQSWPDVGRGRRDHLRDGRAGYGSAARVIERGRASRPDDAEPRARRKRSPLARSSCPGGQAVLLTITATAGGIDAARVAVLDLRNLSAPPKILVTGGSQAHYVSSGHLVYTHAGTLRAVAFDLDRLETIGTSVPVVPEVVTLANGTVPSSTSLAAARWCTRPAARRGTSADTRVGRSPRARGAHQGVASAIICWGTIVTGWDPRGPRNPRPGERYLALGLCPRNARSADDRSGHRSGAGLDARRTSRDIHLRGWRRAGESFLANDRRFGQTGATDSDLEGPAGVGGSQERHDPALGKSPRDRRRHHGPHIRQRLAQPTHTGVSGR